MFQFLWFRQRVFYIHPSLKILSNKCIELISFGIIIIWVFFYIALIPAYFVTVRYHFIAKIGCLIEESSFQPYAYIFIAWTTTTLLMQISLLFLFIYPISKRTLWRGKKHPDRNSLLSKRVKKAIVLTSVSLASDVVSVIITQFIYTKNSSSIISLFGANLLVNHVVTIVCFDHWKKLLWPWNVKNSITKPIASGEAATSTSNTHYRSKI